MATSVGLFEVQDIPVLRVDLWSHKLRTWVYIVPKKTGQNPQGTFEITLEDIARMEELIADGWDTDTAIYRTLGVRPTA